MSVVIKGMTMPETCEKCMFCKWSNLYQTGACTLHDWEPTGAEFSKDYLSKRADWCPLVEIPSKHGDLIDRDAVKEAVFHHLSIKGEENLLPAEKSVFGNIIKAPTIIEAEGE